MNLDAILHERLAIVGGTGSGKSYTARGLVERVLSKPSARVGIIDPTGVWYGLRMGPDGKGAGYPVIMFGGDHSDVPLIETAGRVIAHAVASTHQSWVIDTSALKSKAAERRFMLDFLDAIFEANREDIVLVVDEADRFSPQRMNPETARLHERMEEIVRRGRVRGFTPWLITQRPASLNKDVLSQATAYISMRLTGTHDRRALEDVIEGQADRTTAKAIYDAMPRHKVGSGLVWAPQRDILAPVQFPPIKTADTMRAPKPGERRSEKALPPIDLGKLKEQLATVEAEAKANDPKTLKAEIARLKADLAQKPAAAVDEAAIKAAQQRGYQDGYRTGRMHAFGAGRSLADQFQEIGRQFAEAYAGFEKGFGEAIAKFRADYAAAEARNSSTPNPTPVSVLPPQRKTARPASHMSSTPTDGLTGPQQRILDALAELASLGIREAPRIQVVFLAGYGHPNSKGFVNSIGALSTGGYVAYPRSGTVALTEAGSIAANHRGTPLTSDELQRRVLDLLGNAHGRILQPLIDAYPNQVSRDELCSAAGYGHMNSKGFVNAIGRLRTLGFIDYPQRGQVVALPILFVE